MLAERDLRRLRARVQCQRYLEGKLSHCPHLEFAISIEHDLSVSYNADTDKTEYYDVKEGRWKVQGGEKIIRGEEVMDLLVETFRPYEMEYVFVGEGVSKLRPVPVADYDESKFRNMPFVSPIVAAAQSLKCQHAVPLDSSKESRKILNFSGPYCLDFNIKPPTIDWSNDEVLSDALLRPLRLSTKDDRISRTTKHPFVEYDSVHRLALARIIQTTCLELDMNDGLSEETKAQWDEVLRHHECLRRVFYEAHRDHDEAGR